MPYTESATTSTPPVVSCGMSNGVASKPKSCRIQQQESHERSFLVASSCLLGKKRTSISPASFSGVHTAGSYVIVAFSALSRRKQRNVSQQMCDGLSPIDGSLQKSDRHGLNADLTCKSAFDGVYAGCGPSRAVSGKSARSTTPSRTRCGFRSPPHVIPCTCSTVVSAMLTS
jgi:hypothetical protein